MMGEYLGSCMQCVDKIPWKHAEIWFVMYCDRFGLEKMGNDGENSGIG